MRQFVALNKFFSYHHWLAWTEPKACSNSLNNIPRAFAEIPGPRGPWGMGNLYNYMPIIGKYSWLQLHKAGLDKYRKFGPIVRETIVPGQDIVWLYEPNDIEILLNEKGYPQRRSHLALAKYRQDRPHIYNTAGLLATNGEVWWRLRSEVQKEISLPAKVRSFLTQMNIVTHDFINYLPRDEAFDILPKLARLNLELSFLLTFDKRLQAFTEEEQKTDSRTSRLMRAAEDTNSSTLPTDNGLQLWRIFDTPAYTRLCKAQTYMEQVALEFVEKHGQNSLIGAFMRNPKLQRNDVVGMAADLILAGIDTTSYSMGFAVYHISRHQYVQQLLYDEACRVLPHQNSDLDINDLHNGVPYVRAVLKEVLRLNPISVGVGRILNQDLVLSGYQVPKGTVVVTQNLVACRLEQNFPNALKFIPERWLDKQHTMHKYLLMPFGHGMRACLARRLAEQNILVFLLHLLRNYELIWMGGEEPLDIRTLLINKPSRPVRVLLKKRKY